MYDPNDPFEPNSPMWRQMEEIRRMQEMEDVVDPPAMRALREAVGRQAALRSTYEDFDAFKLHREMLPDVGVSAAVHEALLERESGIVASLNLRGVMGLDALLGITEQLKVSGLLAQPREDILRAAGIIHGTNTVLAALPRFDPPLLASLHLDPTLTSVSAALNDRLHTFGPDALTSTLLSTGGIAAQIAQITQANDYARAALRPQWEAFGGMSTAVDRLYALPEIEGRLNSLPGYLALAPVIEPYASARSLLLFTASDIALEEPLVLDVMAEEILDEMSEELESRLAALDQHLVGSVLGAWDTARSTNPDRVRQACSSIRSAITDVITVVAPKDTADEWVRTQRFGRKSVVPEGAKEARSARKWAPQVRFVFRGADSVVGGDGLLSEVAEADLADMLLLLERLNVAVHKGQREVEVDDLAPVMRRATAFLSLLLDAHQMN